jgi:hypothetical protein
MSAGLRATVAYTWSHTLDDSNGAFNGGSAATSNGFGTINGIRQYSERQMELAAHINF